jgi:hypothetical protein
MLKFKAVLAVAFLLCVVDHAMGQLSFPNGTVLNLDMKTAYVYEETEIPFHTSAYKISDYFFQKDSVSIDSRWQVDACMNGDCKVGLPDTGPFIRDFGYNDTTGFIRFHVNSFDSSGSSRISYTVGNSKNMFDTQVLTFILVYSKSTGIAAVPANNNIAIYPNPAHDVLTLSGLADSYSGQSVTLTDICGKVVDSFRVTGNTVSIPLTEKNMARGIYFVKITDGEQSFVKKIAIE